MDILQDVSSNQRKSGYRVRLSDDERVRLYSKADAAGVPLADAFRLGAEQYLDGQIARKTGTEEPDLVAELRSLGARIERRLSGD